MRSQVVKKHHVLSLLCSSSWACLTSYINSLHYREQLIRISDSIILKEARQRDKFLLFMLYSCLAESSALWCWRRRWLWLPSSSFWQINPKNRKWMRKNQELPFPAFWIPWMWNFSRTSTNWTQEERWHFIVADVSVVDLSKRGGVRFNYSIYHKKSTSRLNIKDLSTNQSLLANALKVGKSLTFLRYL